MPLHANEFSERVVARLRDFVDRRTQWHRRLWVTGNVLALKEIVEIHEDPSVWPKPRLEARLSAIPALANDWGIGDDVRRSQLNTLLGKKDDLVADSHELLQISRIAYTAERGYLRRWGDAIEAGQVNNVGAEHVSRHVASYLLDGGSSPDHLHRWLTRWAIKEPAQISLADLLRKADDEIAGVTQNFTVLVLFEKFVDFGQTPEGFIAPDQVAAWLSGHGYAPNKLGAGDWRGGLELHISALDPGAAVEIAAELLDTFRSRIEIGQRHLGAAADNFRPHHRALVVGLPAAVQLSPRRQVELFTLSRTGKLFSTDGESSIDSAINLVSYLDREAPAAAVAGAWAAIESLLKGSSANGAEIAARQLANLAACSYPRAELTALAKARSKHSDYLADEIRACATNRERSEVIAASIGCDIDLDLTSVSDQAAVQRIKEIIADPRAKLQTMRNHMNITLQRLYRQRNLVMHGGRTDAIALRATLRACAPVVGAAFDRIAHAWFDRGTKPRSLAAQGELALALVTASPPTSLTTLLED